MRFPVSDGHCDYLFGQVNSGYVFDNPVSNQAINLQDMKSGNVAIQFFAAWIDTDQKIPPVDQCLLMIDAYHGLMNKHPELCPLTRDFTPDSGKIATVLAIEGGEAIDGSLSILRDFYVLGVRAMTLTWNSNNELAGSSQGWGNRGLSPLGKEVVEEMERIGIAVDVSHLSDKGIEDVLKITKKPIFASHSNCRTVFHSARSLPDEYIREIARRGGTVGINFYNKQLTTKKLATVEDIVNHIVHLREIGGLNCCAIGSDFDGMPIYPKGLESSSGLQLISDKLLEIGFSEDDVYKVMYQNLHDYIVQFC